LADAALLFRQTAAVDNGTLCGLGFSDAANSAHDKSPSLTNWGVEHGVSTDCQSSVFRTLALELKLFNPRAPTPLLLE
jgi:hypothetical protein